MERTGTKSTDIKLLKSLNEKQRREHFIKKYHIDTYNRIIDFDKIVELENFTKMVYHYVYDIPKVICKSCEMETKFLGFNKGYNIYCSNKCAMSDKEIIDKRNNNSIKTCLNRYGVTNASKLESVKNKTKKTNIEKWGVDNYTKTDEYKEFMINHNNDKHGVDWYQQSEDFIKKTIKTNLLKRGVEHHTKDNKFKDFLIKKNIEKWGVDNYTKTDEYKNTMDEYYKSSKFSEDINKQKNNNKIKIFDYYNNYNSNYNLIKIELDILSLTCKSCDKQFEINKQLYYLRTKRNMVCCTICNPKNSNNTSIAEKEVFSYIKSIYDNEIIENYRNGIELDIYLPDLKIGFEYNGLWYHSEYNKEKEYHLNKLNHFDKLDIKTFTIWEDDWLYKTDIVKSMISNLLSNNKERIMARKCKIVELDNTICNNFLENNHLQSKSNSSIRIGLYHDNELVSIMTFGKLRKSLGYKSIDGHFELIRFCNKLNTSVVGSASKLLNYFIKNYSPKNILSYADKSRSNGNLYNKLGFTNIGNTKPNYFWCKNGLKYNRYSFRKDILIKRGYDKNKTENEIMHDLNYYKVYNCGNIKFELEIK